MTMHVKLSPEMEGFIKNKVAVGFYGNATEVIRDAIRRMQAEVTRVAAWQAAIRKGDDELNSGESIDYSVSTREEITQEALKAMHSGRRMDPDVLP